MITKPNASPETIITIGALINGAAEKTTPIDADLVGLVDSVAANILKKLSWENIKATLKTYFDSLYIASGLAASVTLTPANPTGTSSATYRMMGLGSTLQFTPLKTGKVKINIAGKCLGTTANLEINAKLVWGTGGVPGNGVAPSGTQIGAIYNNGIVATSGACTSSFSKGGVASLVAGTAYWFDLQLCRGSVSGTVSVVNLEATIQELVS
jgi:hypothetical protein